MNTNTDQEKAREEWFQKRANEELESRIKVLELRLKKLGYTVTRKENTLIVEHAGKSLTASFNKDRIEEAIIIGGNEVRVDREKVLAGHTRHIRNELRVPEREQTQPNPEQQKKREQELDQTISESELEDPETSPSI